MSAVYFANTLGFSFASMSKFNRDRPITDHDSAVCTGDVEVLRVPVGGMIARRGPAVFTTLLGSCVGLIVQDRAKQIGAMAHVVLPAGGEVDVGPGYYADRALDGALQSVLDLGGDRDRVVVRLAGGSDMLESGDGVKIGIRNIEALVNGASDADLVFAGVQYGSESGSFLILDVSSGELYVEPLLDQDGVSTRPQRTALIAKLTKGRAE